MGVERKMRRRPPHFDAPPDGFQKRLGSPPAHADFPSAFEEIPEAAARGSTVAEDGGGARSWRTKAVMAGEESMEKARIPWW